MAVLSHCLLSIYIYIHKPGYSQQYWKKFLLAVGSTQNRDVQLINVRRIREWVLRTKLNGTAMLTPSPPRHREHQWRGGCEKDCESQMMVRNAMKLYLLNMMWLSQSWIHTHTQVQVYQNPSIDGEVDLQTYPQTNDLLRVGSCMGGEIIFYWECSHWWVSHTGEWMTPYPYIKRQC